MKTLIYSLLILLTASLVFSSCQSPKIIKASQRNYIEQEYNEQRTLKRKVAIARFSNETKQARGLFYDQNNDPFGKQALDILSARLASTNKFLLLERADIGKVIDELNIGNKEISQIDADYIIVGSITQLGRSTTGDVGIFSSSKKQVADATVSIRMVEVRTGEVIYSAEGSGQASSEVKKVMGVGGRAGYDQSLDDKAISAAVSKLVDNIIKTMLDKPWRSYIISNEDNHIIIAGGESQNIIGGDTFDVLKKGKMLKNPQTGMMIELPGTKVAELQVISTAGNSEKNEISICQLLSGSISDYNFSELYIQEQE